jgi:hypothetical protein
VVTPGDAASAPPATPRCLMNSLRFFMLPRIVHENNQSSAV